MQTTYPFSKERRFQSQQRKNENESNITATRLLLFIFACLVELWKGENFQKVTLGNSYWTRESQYDIGVDSTNETKNFFVFFIRNPISKRAHTQTLTSMVGTTSALRREHEQEFSYIIYL